jgi:cytochrome c-type biogenesis protein CcmH/NrfG
MSEDINQAILVELRKLKRLFYAILFFFILASVPAFYAGLTHDSPDSWERVSAAMRQQNFPAALSMAQSLVRQQPDYYYGHAYLGVIYLAMDDVTNAEVQYSRAYQLFPNEDGRKDLAAVQKRLAAEAGFKLQSTTTLLNTALQPTASTP